MPAEYWIDGLPSNTPIPAGDKYWLHGLPEGSFPVAAGNTIIISSGILSRAAITAPIIAGPITILAGILSGAAIGSPVVAGPIIIDVGVLSGTAVGQPLLTQTGPDQTIQVAAGILSGAATNAPEIGHQIRIANGIASGAAIGVPVILGFTALAFRFSIDGTDRASYVAPGSFRRRLELNSRGTAEFVTRDPSNTYRPEITQEVIVYEGNTRVFAGEIEALEEIVHEGTECNEILVRCNDYGVLCDRRICARYYPLGSYSTGWAMVMDIAQRDLAGTGINYVHDWVPAPTLGEMLFNYVTVSEAINRIMEAVGGWWRVDFWGNLRIFPADQGYEPAPFGLTEGSENWVEMRVERSRSKYRNRQGVRTNRGLRSIWTDTAGVYPMAAPNGSITFFDTTYTPPAIPIVKVNGIEQVVCAAGEWTEGWQWYYFPNGYGITQNANEPKVQAEDTLTVEYPSPLDYIIWAQDDAEIAARGLYEAVEEIQDTGVQNLTSLQAIADALLARSKVIPVGCTFRTDTPGLEPGQLITINTQRPLLDDMLLIEQIESWQEADLFLRHVVRCSNAPQRIADSSGFFARLIERTKLAVNRTVEIIRFTVAETVEGAPAPSVTIGLKEATATSQHAGVLGSVRLSFPAHPPTVSDITIDVKMDGVSVFGAVKLTFPANGSGVYEQWAFASNPLAVPAGSVFTYEITAADATAHDGILEIVILL